MKRTMGVAAAVLLALGLATGCKKEQPKTEAPKEPAKEATPQAGKSGEEPSTAGPEATAGKDAAPSTEGTAATPAEDRLEGPAATVNGKPIPSTEYYAELDKVQQHGAKIPDDRLKRIKDNILKRLIEAELVKQSVEKEGIAVSDAEVGDAFKEYKDRFKSEEQFQNYLKHGKITEDSIKDRIREKKALEKLIEKKGNLAVTDDEAREFYDKNQRFYREKEGVKARHVLVKLAQNAKPEDEKAALEKIKEAEKALKAGEDFAAVAEKMSEGPSAPKGGDLGFFSRGQMVKPFEDKAFELKIGEVSEPVRTRFGYHLIKVEDKREDKQKSFDEVKPQIIESLKNKKFFQERRRLLEDLRKEAKIEKFVS